MNILYRLSVVYNLYSLDYINMIVFVNSFNVLYENETMFCVPIDIEMQNVISKRHFNFLNTNQNPAQMDRRNTTNNLFYNQTLTW